ncbi:MAG: YdiU family protein [Xanthomonadales bacterium]|nr:YdiU family protein [Xanthomonadales bacterium]
MNTIPFENQFITLGDEFYTKTKPTPVAEPTLIKFNQDLAESLGLSAKNYDSNNAVGIFSGNIIPTGAEPLAMAYAGHQFSQFNPQLGDGRAILLGEIVNPDGKRFDLQLKGSGRTAYSRGGDGRSALGPVLREYLVSEAMEKLGVPSTRALAAVTTGEIVHREQLLPGGIITRIATSFIRVGTFQFFAAQGKTDAVKKLADHVIERNYPQIKSQAGNSEITYANFLQAVVDRQAVLIAQWMQLGFIHGVMNTDNMSIAGETIDYGPCAFMDDYAHNKVFSAIDRNGRYAYNNQPSIGLWNLSRLAETLLPLLAQTPEAAIEIAQEILKTYIDTHENKWLAGMRVKCGLTNSTQGNDDKALIEALFETMAANSADFTLTFFHLSRLNKQICESNTEHENALRNLFDKPEQLDDWLTQWRTRLDDETQSDKQRQIKMQTINPVYIPRNHQIEAVIRAAEDHNDFTAFHALHKVLQNPHTQQQGNDLYQLPPKPGEVIANTFCGT